jgi:hypothetical protein
VGVHPAPRHRRRARRLHYPEREIVALARGSASLIHFAVYAVDDLHLLSVRSRLLCCSYAKKH